MGTQAENIICLATFLSKFNCWILEMLTNQRKRALEVLAEIDSSAFITKWYRDKMFYPIFVNSDD